MPTSERLRGKLSAVIPRHEWRKLLMQWFFAERTFQEPCTTTGQWQFRGATPGGISIEIFLAKMMFGRYTAFTASSDMSMSGAL
jgi:hypothetical protein